MRRCIGCGINYADDEPYCPLCGPETAAESLLPHRERASYAARPKVLHQRVYSLIVPDQHIFLIFSLFLLISAGVLIGINLFDTGSVTWSRFTSAAALLIWGTVVLPYAFYSFKGSRYLLICAVTVSLFLWYIDIQTGGSVWFWIPGSLLMLSAIINWIRFSVKQS